MNECIEYGKILDGKSLSQKLRDRLKNKISDTKNTPHLVAILVGEDSASHVYIKMKKKACLEVGIRFTLINLPTDTSTEIVIKEIDNINRDIDIHGCLVQLPLPKQINEQLIINRVDPQKDVDCFHPLNIGLMALNQPHFVPATPYGIQMMIEEYKIPTKGKNCVIIGKSLIVGQPLMNLMSLESGMAATVTCCDKWTENLSQYTKKADILIVAAGVHHLINNLDMIKDGAVVIDVGIHRIKDSTRKSGHKLQGDVNFEALKNKCSYITPVPGGVGPMTVVALLYNTYKAYSVLLENKKF
tara:strand:+ start:3208 stop:4107 length:900 start_codon:yes stop_codon:yes gene_type:complete